MLGVAVAGAVVTSESLNLLGLTATILLVPVWSVWAGVSVLRWRATTVSPI